MKLQILTVGLFSGLLLLAAATPAGAASGLSAGQLDELETRICSSESGLKRSRAAVEDIRRTVVPEVSSNASIEAQRERMARLQLKQRALEAQQSIVVDTQAQLLAAQAEYRRATGAEFNLRECAGGIVRMTHQAKEQARIEAEQRAVYAMTQRVEQEGEEVRRALARDLEACQAHRLLEANQGTPAELEAARREYAKFNAAHQRFYGRAFDFSRCPQ